ncbi:MAG: copper-binding protein [Opitutaceae bacterium]|nr:copper-binding protein [Opitutaceae bacterium]
MKRSVALLTLALAPALLAAADNNCGCSCCEGKEVCCCRAPKAQATAAKSHPLRGVIVDVRPDESALMVRHEAIPGVMRAMTMLFKVDPATLKVVRKGQTITGQMSREGDEWRLHDVKVVAPAPGS